jgi:hypothetical protein
MLGRRQCCASNVLADLGVADSVGLGPGGGYIPMPRGSTIRPRNLCNELCNGTIALVESAVFAGFCGPSRLP